MDGKHTWLLYNLPMKSVDIAGVNDLSQYTKVWLRGNRFLKAMQPEGSVQLLAFGWSQSSPRGSHSAILDEYHGPIESYIDA